MASPLELQSRTTAIYARTSIKHLKRVHDETHPTAKLTPKKKATEPEVEVTPRTYLRPSKTRPTTQTTGSSGSDPTMAVGGAPGYHLGVTQPMRAHVQNGRLVLDEPTDLPEGEVVELVPVDEVLARGGDYLDDEERKRLDESL